MPANDNIQAVPVPQNYKYCCDVYRVMEEEAQPVEVEGVRMMVWEGFTTKLITERLNFSVPYYSTLTLELKRMGCIRQLRRGGGSSPSQWELIRPPTEDLYRDIPAKRTTATAKQEALEQQLRDMSQRLNRVEEDLGTILDTFSTSRGTFILKGNKPTRELKEEAG